MSYSIRDEQEELSAQIEITGCWFCEREPDATCECGRAYCTEHSYDGRCLLCALGFGLFEGGTEVEPLSGLLMISLGAAAGALFGASVDRAARRIVYVSPEWQ